MAKSEFANSISELSGNIDKLIDSRNFLKAKIIDLQEENSSLKLQLKETRDELSSALKEVEFLKLSYRLAASPEALVAARSKISKLLRTIDSCIRLLKED